MDTNKLKRFAVEARTILMQGVKNRLQAMGFDLKTGKAIEMPQAIEGGAVFMGEIVSTDFYRRWMSLYNNVSARGIKQVAEEAAYTWFNRLVAIRIMQKQGFISPVLAYESEEVRVPVIVSEARQGRMPKMAADVREKLMALLDDDSKTNEQFALLIVAYCHENPIINKCFGNITDYTELLLPQNILAEGGFVSMLNNTEFIKDDDFRSAELIGWLYQFYISDRKDEAFAKKGKYDADEIAPATQIFTPNWIVKYMVENTVGRIYVDNNPYCEVKDSMKYLVDTSAGGGDTLPVDDLSELTVADLACGSGHILNECFDLLYQIYVEEGYSRTQAIQNILRRNLLGIDLDTRAKQLATFALLMKACQKDEAFLDARVMPRVYDMPHPIAETIAAEGDERTAEEYLRDTLPHYLLGCNDEMVNELTDAILLMNHADTLGSIMKFDITEQTRNAVMVRTEEYEKQLANGEIVPSAIQLLMPYMRIILALTQKYAALCMNPPYMGSGRFDEVLSKYVKDNYETGKADLFSVFMLMGMERLAPNGKMAQINMQSWMFLSSFEKLRTQLLTNYNVDSMLHLGPRTFDELSGEVVQNTAFVISKHAPTLQGGTYYRLVDGKNCADKEQLFLSHIHGNEEGNRIYYPNVVQKNFEKIPGERIGYWFKEKNLDLFKEQKIDNLFFVGHGILTGHDEGMIRQWTEMNYKEIAFNCNSAKEFHSTSKKYVPFVKGGNFRRWYGNLSLLLKYDQATINGMRKYPKFTQQNEDKYFQEGATWAFELYGNNMSVRYMPKGCIFSHRGPGIIGKTLDDTYKALSFTISKVCGYFVRFFNPTISCSAGILKEIPVVELDKWDKNIVKKCIFISKLDWDSHETSWDFEENPLVALAKRIGGAVSHRTTEERHYVNESCKSGETPLLLKGGAVSHCATENIAGNADNWCGGTPHDSWCGETPHLLKFVNKREYIDIMGSKLPHWNQAGCVQFVTFRLADSLPQAKLMEYRQMKEEWLALHPKPWDETTQGEYDSTIGNKIDKWLDAGYGCCLLQDEAARRIVEDSILHFNGEKYCLYAYVIMPNHVHVLLTPGDGNTIQGIVGGWKKFTAHEINKQLNREGTVWERESFDRMVRSNNDFEAKLNYIADNPQHLPASAYTIGGAVSHCATENTSGYAADWCGETPHLLMADLVEQFEADWTEKFMQLHENEEQLNREFISIYGLEDELSPDVPLSEITILQQGEISIETEQQ